MSDNAGADGMNVVETVTVHPIMMDVPGDTDPRWKRKPPQAKRGR